MQKQFFSEVNCAFVANRDIGNFVHFCAVFHLSYSIHILINITKNM